MSEAKNNLAIALVRAQMSMGKALKQSNNPHFRSKYADLGNVMDACVPALNEQGIAIIQPTGEDENGRYVETMLIHGESGETLSCRVPLIVSKNDMQGYGSAVTYARRYGLMSMAGIAPEDDDGTAAAKSAPKHDGDAVRGLNDAIEKAIKALGGASDIEALKKTFLGLHKDVKASPNVVKAKDDRKAALDKVDASNDPQGDGPIEDDFIPH